MVSKEFDAVLFDFGGVLSDGPFDAFAAYEAANGLPDGFIRGLNANNHETNAWSKLERGEVDIDAFCELFEAEAQLAGGSIDGRVVLESLRGVPRPNMIDAVRCCHEHFKTALLTNNFIALKDGEGFDWLAELFDEIVESAVERVRKPDPRFYLIACDRLGVEPDRCVFLDDLGINLKPARELGMTTIKVVDPATAITDLETVLDLLLL